MLVAAPCSLVNMVARAETKRQSFNHAAEDMVPCTLQGRKILCHDSHSDQATFGPILHTYARLLLSPLSFCLPLTDASIQIVEDLCVGEPHEDFRLWLSSGPHPKFPISILRRGLKMTTEPPAGLRANVSTLYNIVSPVRETSYRVLL